MFRPDPPQLLCIRRALLACALALSAVLAGALAGCARPDEPLHGAAASVSGAVTGSLPGKPATVAPWQTRASASAEAARALSEPEGEVVVATAIAVHEMRRP